MKKYKLAVYAIHPIMYQTPIFREMESYIVDNKLDMDLTVLYGDDLSLRDVYFKETNVTFKPDVPFLLEGYKYKFLKNYARDSRAGFLSRVNFSVFQEIKNENYDAVLIHGYESLTAWMTLIAAKMNKKKVIWRGESVLRGIENASNIKQRIKRAVLKRFFGYCDSVLYSCSGNKEYLRFYGVDEEKLFSIPCAVNNEYFQEQKQLILNSQASLKNELGIDKDNMVVLFSARFTQRKRPLDLLQSLTKIEHSKITVLFVGDGPERATMEAFADENNINAVFVGFRNQSEISAYYAIADINIVISDYDPSPKAMNEAMNFALPVIVTEVVGTARDLVFDEDNGYVISVGDIDTLSKKIDGFQKDRELIEKMGQRSLEIISEWNYKSNVIGILDAIDYASKK